MKFFKFLAIAAISFASNFAVANRVEIQLESPTMISAGNTVVSFQLLDTATNTAVTPTELNISHQKKLHFIAYDPALKEFQHVHPDFDGKVWNVDMSFAVDGNYFIWAQGEFTDSTEFNAQTRIMVMGGQPEWPAPTLSDSRSGTESGSIATLSNQALIADKMTMLTLRFTRVDGSKPQITPYLGAFAHIIATPEDGSTLIHIHPMNGSSLDTGMVHVSFPVGGLYRLWVQFIDGGVLKTVPLSVAVTGQTGTPAPACPQGEHWDAQMGMCM